MQRPTIYITLQHFCEHDDRPRQALAAAGLDVRENPLHRRLQRDEMLELLRHADAVVAGVEPYDAQVLTALPRLRCISRCGIGTDAIDLAAAQQRGIAVYATPDEVTAPAAQLTIAMILALARNLPLHVASFRAGQWSKHTGALLEEWTIGLVGFGRIGRAVADYLRPFGPRLLVSDPAMTAAQVPAHVTLRDLPTLLADADLVSLHAARRPQEVALLGRQELARMKQGSYVVNTSRGFLIDESALYEALVAGRLAGAALDVFSAEPYAGPLAALPQVLCTPHVATLTRTSRAAMELRAVRNIIAHFASPERLHAQAARPA